TLELLKPLRVALVASTLLAVAQAMPEAVPRIDPASVRIEPGMTFGFQFQSLGQDPGAFVAEVASDLGVSAGWNEAVDAVIAAESEGHFRVTLPMDGDRLFCRIRALDSGGPGPVVLINEVMSDNETAFADEDGSFWDWIELYNPNDEAVDLTGYALSDEAAAPGKWRFPAVLIQPHGFLLVYASNLDRTDPEQPLHASFRLSASGETVLVSDSGLRPLDQWQVPSLASDQSIGRMPDGAAERHLYGKDAVSPGGENAVIGNAPVVLAPTFAPDGGFFSGPVEVTIEPSQPDHEVRYTIDGMPPTPASPVWTGPLNLETSTVVRVVAIDAEGRLSEPESRSFFIGVEHELPVVSLATAPSHLAFRNGYLYGLGSSVLSSQNQVLKTFPYYGSNAWQDREIEVALEFFEPDGRVGLRQRAGAKMFGGWGSRGYPQKSFALFARRSYGAGKFDHRIFPDQSITEFEAFVLRNSGNDNQSTHQTPPRPPINEFGTTLSYGSYFVNGEFTLMRDALMQRLVEDTTLDTQAYRPAVVYINGEYWGIYNLREKMNESYVLSHHDRAAGSVDLIEGLGSVKAGSSTYYNQMRNYLSTQNLADDARYDFVAEQYLDIDNFIDYQLTILYGGNFDIGNVKCWRPRAARGRFRWLVYDQDYAFDLWPADIYQSAMARDYADYRNMFRFYTTGTNPSVGWPNGAGQTLIFRSLLKNERFKQRFIRRCTDLLNSLFRQTQVDQTITDMAAVIRPEIGAHLQRWSWDEIAARGFGVPHKPEYQPFLPATWEANINGLYEFAANRAAKTRQDCAQEFGLTGGEGVLEVRVEPQGTGKVVVNTLTPDALPWQGIYFADLANTLRPVPNPGYRFVEWTTPGGPVGSRTLDFNVERDTTSPVVARMEPAPTDPTDPPELIISEIMYHPSAEHDSGDWVELCNPGESPVDLTGWIFRDEDDDHFFLLPERTLEPGACLVLVQDDARFRLLHAPIVDSIGDFGFGLGNGGDTLRLFRPDGTRALAFRYNDAAPWPEEADGDGFTLELVSPEIDPALPGSWKASMDVGGTPGER
ncbi:MAG: CotH kinase family protein, partial [Verrucomicrobiae bacterium]|nr:CotH kinase family protein [Verrucomicrobiae bacterium]